MSETRSADLTTLLDEALARLRREGASGEQDEALVRTLAWYEREVALALRGLANPDDDAPLDLDPEESPAGLQRRLDDYRGRSEGFTKALALLLGHEQAARILDRARGLTGVPSED